MAWASAAEQEHVVRIVREYPKEPHESGFHYLARLALEAGLITDGDTIRRFPPADVLAWTAPARPVPDGVWLPYAREPGEDDE
jgi:hypothetical protein